MLLYNIPWSICISICITSLSRNFAMCSGETVGFGYLVPISMELSQESRQTVFMASDGESVHSTPNSILKCINRKCLVKSWLQLQAKKFISKGARLLVETPIVSVVSPLAILYTGALLWKELKSESKPKREPHRPNENRRKEREKEREKEKARMERKKESKKKEEKIELTREIMGIHADILRLISYTTATGTQAIELADNLRKQAGIEIPGLPGGRKKLKNAKQGSKTKNIANLVDKNVDLQSSLGRLKHLENMLKSLEPL